MKRHGVFIILLALASAALLAGCWGSSKSTSLEVGGGGGVAATATAVGINVCHNCHANTAEGDGTPIFDTWANSKHGNPSPTSHASYANFASDPTCNGASCHDPQGDGLRLVNIAGFFSTRPVVGCEACHGGGSEHFGVGPMAYPTPDATRCAQCHSATSPPEGHRQYHPNAWGGQGNPGIYAAWAGSKHATSINSHVHDSADRTKVRAKCSKCHTDEGGRAYKAIDNVDQLNSTAPLSVYNAVQCRTCHKAHGVDALLEDNTATQSAEYNTCTNCHQAGNAYHDPATNPYGDLAEIITDTHFDNGSRAVGSDIQGYVIRKAADTACTDCHNPHSASIAINRDWAAAGHGDLKGEAWKHYNWRETSPSDRRPCQRCHTATGFMNFANNPSGYNPANNVFVAVDNQSETLYCYGCHKNHSGGLRTPGAITAEYKFNGASAVFPDVSGSNLCVSCHSGRESGESLDTITDFTNASFKNSHYLAVGGLMYVKAGFRGFIALDNSVGGGATTYGQSLTSTEDGGTLSSTHRKLGTAAINGDSHNAAFFTPGNLDSNGPCVTCHMQGAGQPTRSTSHTWKINMNAANEVCIKCHGTEVDTEAHLEEFIEEQALPFDNALALALNRLLVNYNISYNPTKHPYFYDLSIGSDNAAKDWTRGGTLSQADAKKLMGACFNINILTKEPAAYVHARTYARRLLYDTIDFLDDGVINLSTGATAIAYDPVLYGKGTLATSPETTENYKYLAGYSRSTGAWNAIERP